MEKINLPEEIQSIINRKISELSYGVSILKDGNVLNIRREFDLLVEMWKEYIFCLEMEPKEYSSFMSKTKGVFTNGEIFIRFSDIEALVNGEETEHNNKKGIDRRNYADIIDSALSVIQEESDDNDDDDEDEETN